MKKQNMTPEEIKKHNAQVDYNNSVGGWVADIICSLIAWPMIIPIIHRRMKYRDKIHTDDNTTPSDATNRYRHREAAGNLSERQPTDRIVPR